VYLPWWLWLLLVPLYLVVLAIYWTGWAAIKLVALPFRRRRR
jgi:hypothetical protein